MKTRILVSILLLITACTAEIGPQGPSGTNGTNGINGTSVTLVKFCTNSSFPELGFCINQKLYAIYDQSNHYDYLVEIVPGHYSSQATGASCSFTVTANCGVVN